MKIALCISGYLRTFEECYPSIKKNIIDGNDVDIFIHTYDKIGNSSGWRSPIDLSEDIDMNFLESIPNIKVIAVQKWDNIKYQFEKFREFNYNITNINIMATFFYKIYMCNELRKQYEKENNIKYDRVIRMRGDLFFEKKVDLTFPENKILINAYPWGDEDYVHVYPGNKDFMEFHINDRFAVGTSKNIDIISNLYNDLDILLPNVDFQVTEKLLYTYINSKNIEVEKKNLSFYIKHKPPRLQKGVYYED